MDCIGTWGACNATTCLETYTVTTAIQNAGISCSANDTDIQACTDPSLCGNLFIALILR